MALTEQTFTFNNKLEKIKFIKCVNKQTGLEEFWFAAKEFATKLGYERPDNVVTTKIDAKYRRKYYEFNRINDDDVYPESRGIDAQRLLVNDECGNAHSHTIFINEPGLYQLVLSSKLKNKNVEDFKMWVFEVVLPTIRKTGKYDHAIAANNRDSSASNDVMLQTIAQNVTQLQQTVASKDNLIRKIISTKDGQIERVMKDLNRMYTGFQHLIQSKDEQARIKDEQMIKLIDKIVDLSDRAVQYPVDERKQPTLCIAREGTTFHAITGQKPYVQQQKNKRNIDGAAIVLETKRPNPTLDWNNAVYEANLQFDKKSLKRNRRSLSFDSSEDAEQFETRIKHLINMDIVKR